MLVFLIPQSPDLSIKTVRMSFPVPNTGTVFMESSRVDPNWAKPIQVESSLTLNMEGLSPILITRVGFSTVCYVKFVLPIRYMEVQAMITILDASGVRKCPMHTVTL